MTTSGIYKELEQNTDLLLEQINTVVISFFLNIPTGFKVQASKSLNVRDFKLITFLEATHIVTLLSLSFLLAFPLTAKGVIEPSRGKEIVQENACVKF